MSTARSLTRPNRRRSGHVAARIAAIAVTLLGSFADRAGASMEMSHGSMAHDAMPHDAGDASAVEPSGMLWDFFGFFDNYGSYKTRIHCLLNAQGQPDWPWIGVLVVLTLGIVVGYLKIFRFWRRSYLVESPQDRNRKLMDLAHIFLWCAVCGYAMSLVMFIWPAYRLLAVFLVVLNVFTWRFAANLGALTVSLSAVRLKRELQESLANRAIELERLVEQRTLELERARQAATDADEAKSAFLANMSHEIRTPMTAILGFTDLLDNPSLDATTRQRHLRTVRESGRHLLAVVNDILDLARIEAGKLKVDRLNCDLYATTQDVINLLMPRAAERNLTLSLIIDASAPRVVQTDPTRLRQILLNLVGNGIKFTEKGSVVVDMRGDPADESRTRIAVIDTGVGMSPAHVSRLFQRFNQGAASTAREYGGSGLGLVISRHLASLLGGDLNVESTLGKGSCFTLTLPFPSEAGMPRDGASGSAETSLRRFDPSPVVEQRPRFQFPPGTNVLLVDDGDENRQLVQFLLEQQGLSVETAEDGQVALDRVEAAPDRYSCVLMDIHMPRIDGYEATSTLRARNFGRPIIALTASTMEGDRKKCLAAGCDEYISKPIDSDLLLRTIHRLLTPGAAMGAS